MPYDKLMELYNQLILLAKELKEYQSLCERESKLYEELAVKYKEQAMNLN